MEQLKQALNKTKEYLKNDPSFIWTYYWSKHQRIKYKFSNNSQNYYVKEIENIISYNMKCFSNSVYEFYKDTTFNNKPTTVNYKTIYNIKCDNLILINISFQDSNNNDMFTIPLENLLIEYNFDIVGCLEPNNILVKPNNDFIKQLKEVLVELVLTSGPMVHVYDDKFIKIQ